MRLQEDIEDGWGSCSPVVASSPLRLAAKTRRSTSPGFAGGGRSSLAAGGGGGALRSSVTAGAGFSELERIGFAFALEARGLELRQAFDVGAAERENADAFDEVDEGAGARRAVKRLLARHEAELCDLMGASADGEAERCLVVDQGGFEGDAGFGVGCEIVEGVVIEDQLDHHVDAVAQGRDALAHGVQWEEVAQDDPEPFHALSIASGFCPAD